MIIWSYDHMTIWSYGHMIIWSYDHVIIWSYDHTIISSLWWYDHMIIWTYDHRMISSYDHIKQILLQIRLEIYYKNGVFLKTSQDPSITFCSKFGPPSTTQQNLLKGVTRHKNHKKWPTIRTRPILALPHNAFLNGSKIARIAPILMIFT